MKKRTGRKVITVIFGCYCVYVRTVPICMDDLDIIQNGRRSIQQDTVLYPKGSNYAGIQRNAYNPFHNI